MNHPKCLKCGGNKRLLVYRREGSSGYQKPNPETWLCAVCTGETVQVRGER